MTASAVTAAVAAAVAVWTVAGLPPERSWARLVPPGAPRPAGSPVAVGALRRWRVVWSGLGGCAGFSFVDGSAGVVAGLLAAAGVWTVCTRAESPGVRREREAARRDLPHVARLLAIALGAGQSVAASMAVVSEALPGPAAAPLARARSALAVGVPVAAVYAELAATPGLEPLGRALARSAESGASVADVVARLADQLAADVHATVEDRARTVGIRAAVPLGLCLLPAFLLVGIVPVVAAALGDLAW